MNRLFLFSSSFLHLHYNYQYGRRFEIITNTKHIRNIYTKQNVFFIFNCQERNSKVRFSLFYYLFFLLVYFFSSSNFALNIHDLYYYYIYFLTSHIGTAVG